MNRDFPPTAGVLQELRLAILTFFTLPWALVGGVLAAFFVSGGTISLGSLVGFLTILGIAARNGIMLISHYQHLEEGEGETFGPGLALRGTEERLAPILMTALATGLALVPLVIAGNIPGHEKEALQEVLGDPDARLELRPEFEERLRQTVSYVTSGGRLLSMEELTSQLDASDVTNSQAKRPSGSSPRTRKAQTHQPGRPSSDSEWPI